MKYKVNFLRNIKLFFKLLSYLYFLLLTYIKIKFFTKNKNSCFDFKKVNSKENSITHKFKNNWAKAAKCLSFCFAIFFVFLVIFYSPKSSSTTLDSCTLLPPSSQNPGVNCLPNCNSLDNSITPNVGVNCLYFDLPICTSNSQATSIISNPQPRINCADVIDLPLCSDFNSNPRELKNCVKKCSEITTGTGIRGVDYAVHNRHCVRFCSDISETLTDPSFLALPQNQKCVAARCHQILEGDTGNNNCNLLSCKLLTVEELNKNKFQDETKKYCDGEADKCYNFSQDKLQYLIPNKMCKIHTCPPMPQPASPSCNDDTNNIINKGNSFTQDYLRYINKEETPATTNLEVKEQLSEKCEDSNQICLPLVKRQYRCEALTDENPPTKPNNNCDAQESCDENGFCSKIIDCNISPTEPECIQPITDPQDIVLDEDDDSWFYNPAPMDKALNSSTKLLRSNMRDRLCYNKSDLKDNGWGKDVTLLGYFHSQFQPDKTRSPGMCDVAKGGSRGTGYLYLCGNEGLLNAKVSPWTAYNSSIYSTTFTNTDSTTKVKVCLRFKNSFRPMDTVSDSETCGKRECAISCAFGLCKSQLCGDDVCRTLTVKETKATDCIMNNNMFQNTSDKSCSSIIDNNLRVRAVQYGNKVCTFLDSKGQLAYNDMFMNGKETLSDGTCLGETGSDGSCEGKDSNDIEGQATFWRAVMLIKHAINNRNSAPRGYVKKDGKLVEEQECIKIPLRVRTPRLYNLVTKNNAFKLFTPPVYISNSYVERDSNQASLPESTSDKFGPTDFNYPKIEVTYGEDTKQILSLDLNKTGYETESDNPDSNASASITTNFNGYNYETEILIRKELNSETLDPTLCLYQKITDTLGNQQTVKLECINRTLPEINNNPLGTPTRKVVISALSTNTYDNAQISLKYQGISGATSSETILKNTIQSNPECSSIVENYKICAQREECNKLHNEFALNEINIQNAAIGSDTSEMLALRIYFTNTLAPLCNKKSGYLTDTTVTPNVSYQASNAYGWFDEICISSGFETKLKNIVAYKVFDNKGNEVPSIKGKCVIDLSRSSGNCANGGKPKENGSTQANCICLDYVDGISLNSNQVVRKQTLREAGLCVNIPTPAMCPAISYSSDAARTAGTTTGNADFLTEAYGGMNNVIGQCVGNWRNSQVNGVSVPPMMNCVKNSDNTASWNYSVINPCQRYSCPIITTEPRINAGVVSYTNSYTTANETTDDNQGQSHGFALWNSKTSSDTTQTDSAISCITGFRVNGTLPTRGCNSKGIWQNVTNACVRKTCPAINFVSNSDFDSSQWNQDWQVSSKNPLRNDISDSQRYNIWSGWNNYGGASFPQTNASRVQISSSTDPIPQGSIATGTCNTKLGYFPLGNGPTMKCDSNGNWVFLENNCVRSCEAISSGSLYDGKASWDEATIPAGQEFTTVSAKSCNSDYYPYPYSSPQDSDGNYINYSVDPQDSTKKIYVENTPLLAPQRKCQNSNITTDNTITKAAIWKNSYPACINKCPGAATDPRVGVGITKHRLSNGSYIYLEWGDLNPGESQVLYSSTPQTASDYSPNHATGIYAVKRTCGSNYKWETYIVNGVTEYVKPQCSARNGAINNSNEIITSSYDTIDENAPSSNITVSCETGYATKTTVPQYTCQANSNGLRLIDEFYYAKTGGGECVKSCALPSVGQSFGSGSKYSGSASGTKFVGDTITLSCKTTIDGPNYIAYGKALDSNLSNSDNTCGRAATDRTDTSPTTTCLDTGLWNNSVTNDCYQCRSCNFTAGNVTIEGDTSIKDNSPLNCDASTNKNRDRVCNFDASWMQNPPTSNSNCKIISCTPSDRNPASGSSISCQGQDTEDATDCNSKTMNAFITMSCTDGLATVTSLYK